VEPVDAHVGDYGGVAAIVAAAQRVEAAATSEPETALLHLAVLESSLPPAARRDLAGLFERLRRDLAAGGMLSMTGLPRCVLRQLRGPRGVG
jgi:hypothetical protein